MNTLAELYCVQHNAPFSLPVLFATNATIVLVQCAAPPLAFVLRVGVTARAARITPITAQADQRDVGEAQDQGRRDPVVLVAFREHGLDRGQSDCHGEDAGPVWWRRQAPHWRQGWHGWS